MLSPDKIAAFDQASGLKTASKTSTANVGQSRADEIRQIAKNSSPYTSRVGATMQQGADMAANAYKTGGEELMQHTGEALDEASKEGIGGKVLTGLKEAGNWAGTIAKATIGAGMGAAKAAAAPISQIKTPEGDTVGERFSEPVKQSAHDIADSFTEAHPDVINWWHQLDPGVQQGISNLVNTIGLTGAGRVADTPIPAISEGVSTLRAGASDAAQGVKDLTTGAKGALESAGNSASKAATLVKGKGTTSFEDVYNAHSQSSKALSNTFKKATITKDGKTITPVQTIQGYEATPKVASNAKGGHVLDMSDVKTEAVAKGKAASKIVDEKAANITKTTSKKQLTTTALDAAKNDKEIVRTASLPAVQSQIKQIFSDYGVKGDKITGEQLNEFRKGANAASQAYYNSQRVAATAGTIPKDVADRAQAFAVLGDVFRDELTKLDPSLDGAITDLRVNNAALEYATRAHLTPVGLSGPMKAMVDAGGAGAGALVGSTLGPLGTVVGAGGGVAATEKIQTMLLKRLYEGAEKSQKPNINRYSLSSGASSKDAINDISGSVSPKEGSVNTSQDIPLDKVDVIPADEAKTLADLRASKIGGQPFSNDHITTLYNPETGRYTVIDGMHRVEAALKNGNKTIPGVFETIKPTGKK